MSAAPRSPEVVKRARRGVLLSEALAESGTGRPVDLDGGQRLQVLDTLIASLGGAYAHLAAKRAAYAFDPVQALILLRRRAADLSDTEFNRAVTAIVTGLRDAHTRYVGPTTLRNQVAVLPFLAEQYGPETSPRYLVSKINAEAVDDPEFKPGVALEAWNGAPFARAVESHADFETGGRSDSRRARALESLTFRPLDYGPPPDEHWVIVGYRTSRGRKAEIRLPWQLLTPGKAATALEPGSRAALKQAGDPSAEAIRRAKKLVFAPNLWASDRERRPSPAGPGKAKIGEWLDTPMQDVLAARPLTRKVGYLRIWSFDLDDDDAFVDELIRLLGLLPQTGLIIDLRANPGGLIWAAERALQLFTDVTIQPTRFSLIATPLTRQMADSPFNRLELEAWGQSLQDAVSTGELYAQPLPLTDPSWCNDKGRKYPGRSRAVVDANTYCSTIPPSEEMIMVAIRSRSAARGGRPFSLRNELFAMIIWSDLQAIVAFGLQARIAIEQWPTAPSGHMDRSRAATFPSGVPSWLGDDSRGRQSRPKRRNTVERDPADLLHTLIWRAPAG